MSRKSGIRFEKNEIERRNERTNNHVVHTICDLLYRPSSSDTSNNRTASHLRRFASSIG
jgi:hypothetical protein